MHVEVDMLVLGVIVEDNSHFTGVVLNVAYGFGCSRMICHRVNVCVVLSIEMKGWKLVGRYAVYDIFMQ